MQYSSENVRVELEELDKLHKLSSVIAYMGICGRLYSIEHLVKMCYFSLLLCC